MLLHMLTEECKHTEVLKQLKGECSSIRGNLGGGCLRSESAGWYM